MKVVAGVDGGATQTRVALADENGNLLGFGRSGPSNYGSVPIKRVQTHIGEAFRGALEQAELTSGRLDALFMGMAGVVCKADRETIAQVVYDLDGVDSQNIEVDHDIRISLAGGLAGKEGIALIAGTGSSCYGRREDGRDWMSGGWGHLLDDKGSAYDLVCQSLSAVVRAKDGRGGPTLLSDLMMEGLQIDDISEIMRRLYFEGFKGAGKPMTKEEIASLAPLVVKAAKAGDKTAITIIENGVQELTLMVRSVVDALDFSGNTIPIALTGGMAQHSDFMSNKICEEIPKRIEGAKIIDPKFPPVIGGVLLALRISNVDVTSKIIENLRHLMDEKINYSVN